MNKEGDKGWYLFDTQEKSIQRFAEGLYNRNQNEESIPAFQQNAGLIPNTRDLINKEEVSNSQKIISIIILSVITLIGIIVYIRNSKINKTH